jgi:hypothetical protein
MQCRENARRKANHIREERTETRVRKGRADARGNAGQKREASRAEQICEARQGLCARQDMTYTRGKAWQIREVMAYTLVRQGPAHARG